MKIRLETIQPHERGGHFVNCNVCNRHVTIGPVTAWAYSSNMEIDCGPVCTMCLEEGPEKMEQNLEATARVKALVADQQAMLADEGIDEAPTIEEFRMMEKIATL